MSDPMLPAGSRACLCRACGRYFTSPSTFDAHRRGPMAKRRCAVESEMRDAGLEPDEKGRWRRRRAYKVAA